MPNAGYEHGWFQVGFEHEFDAPITPAQVDARRLLLLRDGGSMRAFDADCPHRGAHLALGGSLDGDEHVICPFHGYRIRLGDDGTGLCVREYMAICVGGMVFVRLSDDHDNGWAALLRALAADHIMVPGFEMTVDAPVEMIIENAFDRRHFDTVHGIATQPFATVEEPDGSIAVSSRFSVPETERLRSRDDDGCVGFRVTVASPGVAAASLDGPTSYTIVTGATPTGPGSCVVRITLALPIATWGPAPAAEHYRFLLEHSRRGLDDDARVWVNLSPTATPHLTPEDEPILLFHAFCDRFRADAAS